MCSAGALLEWTLAGTSGVSEVGTPSDDLSLAASHLATSVPSYPTPSDYQEALQYPHAAFSNPELADGEVDAGPLGLPQPITGTFATVFRVETPGGTRAVRCFLSGSEDQQDRYLALERKLRTLRDQSRKGASAYFATFDYEAAGIRVGSERYPLLVMEWVGGINLSRFVEHHLDKPEVLGQLAENWRELVKVMEASDIAHGDLQHGNVLVEDHPDGPRLRLVDYDAAYVPALQKRLAAEVGHRNYQHPDRTERDFGPHLDRFSALIIYSALVAVSRRPELWEQFNTGENLLFTASDFYHAYESAILKELRKDPEMKPLAEAVRRACLAPLEAAPILESVITGTDPVGDEDESLASRWAFLRRVKKISEFRDDRPQAVTRPTIRRGVPRFFVHIALVQVALITLIALAGAYILAGAMIPMGAALLAFLADQTYRRLSIMRRRRRLMREAEVLDKWVGDLERQAEKLDARREELDEDLGALREERLTELRREVLCKYLRKHFISEIQGWEEIGQRAVVRMKAVGIRDAAGATPERVAEARDLTEETRDRINVWRSELLERYDEHAPDELSPAEEQRLQRLLERRGEMMDEESVRVRTQAAEQRAERERVLQRLEALPSYGFGDWLLYLLRIGRAPNPTDGAPDKPRPDPPQPKSTPGSKQVGFSSTTEARKRIHPYEVGLREGAGSGSADDTSEK
ncbi:hypothetical protein BH23BAC4_BH23BAC4_16760 [soil metagenome]